MEKKLTYFLFNRERELSAGSQSTVFKPFSQVTSAKAASKSDVKLFLVISLRFPLNNFNWEAKKQNMPTKYTDPSASA